MHTGTGPAARGARSAGWSSRRWSLRNHTSALAIDASPYCGGGASARRAGAAAVLAWNALVELDQDLVGNRAGAARDLLHGDPCPVLRADQYHLVLVEGAVAADVDHELVHAHAPRHPMAPATDQHLPAGGQRARPAVAIADRHRHHARVLRRGPGRAVSDAVARADHLEVHHLRH